MFARSLGCMFNCVGIWKVLPVNWRNCGHFDNVAVVDRCVLLPQSRLPLLPALFSVLFDRPPGKKAGIAWNNSSLACAPVSVSVSHRAFILCLAQTES